MPEPQAAEFAAAYVTEVELGRAVEPVASPAREDGGSYGRARVLARLHGTPLGFFDLPLKDGRAEPEAVVAAAREQLSAAIADHLEADSIAPAELTAGGLPDGGAHPACAGPDTGTDRLVSVVLCTRDHPEELARAVASVLACDYPKLELIVVDNAPATDATRELISGIDDDRLHYVLEPTAGLSRARNRGLAEARGEIVAYTDDDVAVDRGWIRGLLQGFTLGDHVGLVTGVIPMGALENEFQQYFDDRVQWSENFAPRLFDLKSNRPEHALYPYSAGMFGTGANFAVRAEAAAAIGEFDEALGAGAVTRGGEDLDYFVRTLYCDDWQIAYEPRALVWHYHRADADSLAQQMYGYGTGLTAYAVKTALQPSHFVRVCGLTARFLWLRLVRRDRTYGVDTGHGELQKLQRKGLLAGPWLYLKARRSARRNPPLSRPRG